MTRSIGSHHQMRALIRGIFIVEILGTGGVKSNLSVLLKHLLSFSISSSKSRIEVIELFSNFSQQTLA